MEFSLIEKLKTKENIYLIPPYLKELESKIVSGWKSLHLENHIYFFSSGTTSKKQLKTFIVSKDALFANAKAVNEFLGATENDIWLASLPNFHIGGLSIYARAMLSDSKIISTNSKWDPIFYFNLLNQENISYFSLIPRQLYELVENEFECPSCVKGVFIGGDFLASSLAKKAMHLGWPLIQTYGMSELCSQIATSYYKDIKEGFLKVLPIHLIKGDKIESNSLFSGMMLFEADSYEYFPQESTAFELPDHFELLDLNGQYIRPLGRKGEELKIKGRLVDAMKLKEQIYNYFISINIYQQTEVIFNSNDLGHFVEIYAIDELKEGELKIRSDIEALIPFLKDMIEFTYFKKLPRTSIGKIKRK